MRAGWQRCGAAVLLVLMLGCESAHGAIVRVETDPSGFDLWAGERYIGRTPVEARIPEGRIKLTVAASSESLFFAPLADTILTVSEAETLTLRIPVGRTVSVRSRPFDLPLLRDGIQIGRTPLVFPLDARRPVKLQLVAPSGPVTVPTDSLLAKGSWFWMSSTGASTAVKGGTQSTLRRAGRYVMPGLAVVLAASATLTKDGADESFGKYERTADPGEMSRYFDEARAKDRLATGLWVGVEVCVISSIIAWILPEHRQQEGKEARP